MHPVIYNLPYNFLLYELYIFMYLNKIYENRDQKVIK